MKMKNKVLSAIMAVAMCISFSAINVFAAGTLSLTPSVTEVAAGTEFTVNVNVDSNPGITYLQLSVEYDTGLTLTGVTDGGIISGKQHSGNLLTWQNGTAEENITATGTVATLAFKVDESAVAGNYDIKVSTINTGMLETSNYEYEEVDFGTATTTVSIPKAEKAEPTVETDTKEVAGENNLVTKGYLVSATATSETKAINGITITASANGVDKEVPYTFTTVKDGTVKVAVNVLNVPAGNTVDFSYVLSTVAE